MEEGDEMKIHSHWENGEKSGGKIDTNNPTFDRSSS